jgi:hypothetical protein
MGEDGAVVCGAEWLGIAIAPTIRSAFPRRGAHQSVGRYCSLILKARENRFTFLEGILDGGPLKQLRSEPADAR